MSFTLRKLCLQQASRNIRKSSDYAPAHFKPVTMDDLPVPSGSWQSDFASKQAKYNKQLILGTGFFILSIIVAKSSGLFQLYSLPPQYPPKE